MAICEWLESKTKMMESGQEFQSIGQIKGLS